MKTAITLAMSVLASQASGQACLINVMDEKTKLGHVYVFEQPKWKQPEKMDWVVYCLQEPLEGTKRNVKEINSGINFNDITGIKIVIEPASKNIIEVRLSWHENTIAMKSGILGDVGFVGETANNHIKGEIKSIEALTAQQSTWIDDAMIAEDVSWEFSVQIDQAVERDQQ